MTGIERIAAERERQVSEEGWSAEHDDIHEDQSLALVAALYATPIPLFKMKKWARGVEFNDPWPDSWALGWDKRPKSGNELKPNYDEPRNKRVRQLEKAGALIAAEIDRLLRKV